MSLHHVARTDLNLLVVLDELLRSRSTTAAARRLGRTQSAVSHALRRLRAVFDDPLFVRSGSTLRPTATAERLRAPLDEILSQTEGLLSRAGLGFDASRLERTFSVVGTDYSDILVLPRLLPILRRTAPGVDVVTRPLGDDVERVIQRREIDLAFATGLRSLPGITTEGIREDELVVLLRRGHPALRQRLTLQRYAELDHVLVSPRGLPGGLVDDALQAQGLSRRVVLRVPYFGGAGVVVAKTDLVVTLPAALVSQIAKGLGLVSTKLPLALKPFTFAMSYSATFEGDAAHRWFRELVLSAVRAG